MPVTQCILAPVDTCLSLIVLPPDEAVASAVVMAVLFGSDGHTDSRADGIALGWGGQINNSNKCSDEELRETRWELSNGSIADPTSPVAPNRGSKSPHPNFRQAFEDRK